MKRKEEDQEEIRCSCGWSISISRRSQWVLGDMWHYYESHFELAHR